MKVRSYTNFNVPKSVVMFICCALDWKCTFFGRFGPENLNLFEYAEFDGDIQFFASGQKIPFLANLVQKDKIA